MRIHEGDNKPTMIMESCGLSRKDLQRILHSLTNQEFVEVAEGGHDGCSNNYYYLTEKGTRIIHYIHSAQIQKSLKIANVA